MLFYISGAHCTLQLSLLVDVPFAKSPVLPVFLTVEKIPQTVWLLRGSDRWYQACHGRDVGR